MKKITIRLGFQKGATDVAPVEFGGMPDLGRREGFGQIRSRAADMTAGGFGHDARNNWPPAGSTKKQIRYAVVFSAVLFVTPPVEGGAGV